MIDKHNEDYVPPPPPPYVAFSRGYTLGAAASADSDGFVLDEDVLSTLPDKPDPVDDSKPVTVVQVRTLTGQRLKIRYPDSFRRFTHVYLDVTTFSVTIALSRSLS